MELATLFPVSGAWLIGLLLLILIGLMSWRAFGFFVPFAMAAPDSYRADIPAEINNFYDQVLLRKALQINIHAQFAQLKNIPANSGTNVIKFRRYGLLAAATTALTEGVTPTGKSLTVTDLTATALQYGDFTRISDVVAIQSIDPILTEATGVLGIQMGDTNDTLTRDIIVAGTTVQYASTAVSRVTVAATMTLIEAEVKEAVLTLKTNKATKLFGISGVSPGVGTVPIPATFWGLCHTDIGDFLKGTSGFQKVETYSTNIATLPGEVGRLDEVRFVESTNAKIFTGAGAGGIDVYGTLIVASDAYGVIDLAASQGAGVIFKGLGSSGTSDPLNQRQTLGWKEFYVAKILNDNFMVRVEHAKV
ncbi:MAG: N4-gp56 family major capsid protein [Nitrososphaerales archaeon]